MNTTITNTNLKILLFVPFMLALYILSIQSASADGGKVYSVYDMDKNGYLERTEYKKFFQSKQKRSKNMDIWAFNEVDSNSDNKISEQEMVDVLIKGMKKKKQDK